jgi:hypothetical protein
VGLPDEVEATMGELKGWLGLGFLSCALGCGQGTGVKAGTANGPAEFDDDVRNLEPWNAGELGADAVDTPDDGEPTPAPGEDFVPTLPPLEPGESITAELHTWTWVEVPEAVCQRDDATGMHFNLGDPRKLLILMEGGGACYNASTCTLSLAIHPFGASALDTPAIAEVYGTNIFNRDDPDNPLRDYSFVFFPYCSGDVFAGASRSGVGYEGRTQQGYYNVQAYLKRLIATFPDAEKVVLTGVSAGGFGAGFNYDQVQEAFGPKTRVYLVDDSGPPLDTAQMSPCLQERWREAWSLDDIMPPAELCPGCRDPYGDVGVMGMVQYLAKKYKNRRLALISSVHDGVIREFFGFGLDDCKGLDQPLGIPAVSPMVPAEEYERGLHTLLEYSEEVQGGAVMKGFLIPDSEMHTALILDGALRDTVVDGVSLGEWLRRLVEDDPSWDHAGVRQF